MKREKQDHRDTQLIIGKNVRRLRDEGKLTQEQLAQRSGLHLVEVGRLERGERDMRVSTLSKLAAGFRVPAAELVRGV